MTDPTSSPDPSARLSAPAAERNRGPILDVLRRAAGERLRARNRERHGAARGPLRAGAAGPALAAERSRCAGAALDCRVGCPCRPCQRCRAARVRRARRVLPVDTLDAIVCINMIHISPWACTDALFAGASRLLRPGGVLFLYGPYRREGRHTAPSNEAFDLQLRGRDPSWGVRDLETVVALGLDRGNRLHRGGRDAGEQPERRVPAAASRGAMTRKRASPPGFHYPFRLCARPGSGRAPFRRID